MIVCHQYQWKEHTKLPKKCINSKRPKIELDDFTKPGTWTSCGESKLCLICGCTLIIARSQLRFSYIWQTDFYFFLINGPKCLLIDTNRAKNGGFCRRVLGVRFKNSTIWVQKVHFFFFGGGVPALPKYRSWPRACLSGIVAYWTLVNTSYRV